MKLPKRANNPYNRISPEARAEHQLMQELMLAIGRQALDQNSIPYEEGYEIRPGVTMTPLPQYADKNHITLQVTLNVRVNPNTGAVIGIT